VNNVFGVNDQGLFDPIMHTQGGVNHLMQHLWDAYCVHLAEQLDKRKLEGKPTVELAEAKKKAPASNFATWAAEYLKEIRVTESFFIDGNLGIRLANNVCVAVCPGVEIRGTMQDSGSVAVTEGKSQAGYNGTADTGGTMRI